MSIGVEPQFVLSYARGLQSGVSRVLLMKTSALNPPAITFAILLSSLFHGEPALVAGCPMPSFFAAGAFGAGTNPVALAVGDFNSDNKPDLAVANQQSANVSVLLSKGDGSFHGAVNYSTG